MNIALFGKSVADEHVGYLDQMLRRLEHHQASLKIYKPYFNQVRDKVALPDSFDLFTEYYELAGSTDFLFSVGGDGTLLDTMTLVRDSGIPVLGINLGRLGFLSSISRNDIMPAIDKLFNKEYMLDKRTLLGLKTQNNLFGKLNYALNDLAINRKDSNSLIVTHVYIDDVFLNSYWSDGLIVATPTGSTAYSLSSGGPILTPGSENFVITPIAPHNLTMRPIVISDKSRVRILVEGRDEQFFVSLDSRTEVIDSSVELYIEKEKFNINLVQIASKTFFSTIRDKLNWGLDIRN
ncbi:MAG: NAD kinase [Bacteroidales bacterium]